MATDPPRSPDLQIVHPDFRLTPGGKIPQGSSTQTGHLPRGIRRYLLGIPMVFWLSHEAEVKRWGTSRQHYPLPTPHLILASVSCPCCPAPVNPGPLPSTTVSSPSPPPPWFWPSVIFALIVGALIRTIHLDLLPPGLWYDEAIYALDGVDAMSHPKMFYDTGNHMREPLYIWGLGAWFSIWGVGVVQARLFSAFIGVTILAAFVPLAIRVLQRPGLASSALAGWVLATLMVFVTLRWPVHFSRTIFRAITPTLILILLSHSYLKFQDTLRLRWATLAGIWLGGGLYTYLSWRLVPVLVALWVIHGLFHGTLRSRRGYLGLAVIGTTALALASPLLAHFATHPEHFSGRTSEVSLFTTTEDQIKSDGSVESITRRKPLMESLGAIAGNAAQVALMWNFRGDHVGKHNLPLHPVFDPVSGLFFLLGLFVLVRTARLEFVSFLLITSIGVMSLASILSFGAPNILRTQAMIPATILVFIIGLRWAVDVSVLRWPWMGSRMPWLLGIGLGLMACWQLWTYFGLMPRSHAVRSEFQTDTFTLPARAVKDLKTSGKVTGIIWVPEELAQHPTFAFCTFGTPSIQTYPAAGWQPGSLRPGDAVLLTLRASMLANPRNLREELAKAGPIRRIATIPIRREHGPPVPHAELSLLLPSIP